MTKAIAISPPSDLGVWYPPLCPNQGCKKEHIQKYNSAPPIYLHPGSLHIKIDQKVFAYHIAVLFTPHPGSSIIESSRQHVLDAGGKAYVDDAYVQGSLLTAAAFEPRGPEEVEQEIIFCDHTANSYIKRHMGRGALVREVLPQQLMPNELFLLIMSYFGDLLPLIHKALLEGRFQNKMKLVKDQWALPALPLIHEAIK